MEPDPVVMADARADDTQPAEQVEEATQVNDFAVRLKSIALSGAY